MWKARDVLQAIGICCPRGIAAADIAARMNDLGITLIRAEMTTQDDLTKLLQVQQLVPGFRLNWLLTGYMNTPVTLEQQWAIGLAAKAAGLNVESIEAPNEENNPWAGGGSHGPTDRVNYGGNDGAKQIMVQWAQAVHDWTAANWPGVLRYSGTVIAYDPNQWAADTNSVAGLVDKGNIHVYPQPGQQPSNLDQSGDVGDVGDQFHMVQWAAKALLGSPTAPMVITETGHAGDAVPQPGQVVDLRTQAVICQNCLLDALAQQLFRVSFYYLQDLTPDPNNNQGAEAHYGWHFPDGSPKPVGVCFKRITSLLQDNGPDFVPAPLLVSVDGLGGTRGASGCVVPIARSDGSYVVPVWNEPQIWKDNGPVQPAAITAKVGWVGTFAWQAIDGLSGQVVASGTGTGASLVMFGYPIYLVLTPVGAPPMSTTTPAPAAPAAPAPAAPAAAPAPASTVPLGATVTLGAAVPAGAYTLVPAGNLRPLQIGLSEDAYQGDALVDISLDGKTVVSSLPVVQLRSKAGRQMVPLGMVDATKPHTVIVNFTNDLYGGSPATDRNVYIETFQLGSVTTTVNQVQTGGGPGAPVTIPPA